MSTDSESECDDPQVNKSAKNALSQAKMGAVIVSQSKEIKKDGDTPPSVLAMKEYIDIVGEVNFYCNNTYPDADKPEPLEFNLTSSGPQKRALREKSKISVAAIASTRESYPHG